MSLAITYAQDKQVDIDEEMELNCFPPLVAVQ